MEDIFEELNQEYVDEAAIERNEENDANQGNASDEAEEVKRTVKPKKPVLRPQLKLDPARLTGPRGIGTLQSVFKDFKFKGKGHEKRDLNLLMSHLEHWCLRLFPKMTFDDCLERIEDLGAKKPVQTYVTKIRLGMEGDEPVNRDDDEPVRDEEPDAFDRLIQSSQTQPPPSQASTLTDEQRARMLRNRLIAEERRLKKMQENKQKLLERALGSSQLAQETVSSVGLTVLPSEEAVSSQKPQASQETPLSQPVILRREEGNSPQKALSTTPFSPTSVS